LETGAWTGSPTQGETGLGGVPDDRQLWPTPGNSSRWGIELASFIAAIQGSETQPLALRID